MPGKSGRENVGEFMPGKSGRENVGAEISGKLSEGIIPCRSWPSPRILAAFCTNGMPRALSFKGIIASGPAYATRPMCGVLRIPPKA